MRVCSAELVNGKRRDDERAVRGAEDGCFIADCDESVTLYDLQVFYIILAMVN